MTTEAPPDLRLPGTPKPWMNAGMRALLRTPGLRRWLGRAFAIITVVGARTGTRYSTPVQYMTSDGHFVVMSQRHRTWWRNLRTRPDVELLVAGTPIAGRGAIASGERARELLSTCLVANPRVAKFYGLRPGHDGGFAVADLDRLLERIVVLDITPP